MVSLIFLSINLLSLSTTFFWSQLKLWSDSLQCFAISFLSKSQFLRDILCSEHNFKTIITKVDYFTVTAVNFINNIVFIFCNSTIFRFTKEFTQSVFSVESGSYFVSICHSFSLVPSTYDIFILILIYYPWISAVWVGCCDCGKLWLLAVLLMILLIMLSRYPFSFNTCFILGFSKYKSSLFVIIEYDLLNKEETRLSLQLIWRWELQCQYWSVCIGFLYTNTEIFP